MIQLATDAAPPRLGARAIPAPRAVASGLQRRARSGHAWPFLSRPAPQPLSPETPQVARGLGPAAN